MPSIRVNLCCLLKTQPPMPQHCIQTLPANRHKHRVNTLEDTETDTGSTNQLRLDDDL